MIIKRQLDIFFAFWGEGVREIKQKYVLFYKSVTLTTTTPQFPDLQFFHIFGNPRERG